MSPKTILHKAFEPFCQGSSVCTVREDTSLIVIFKHSNLHSISIGIWDPLGLSFGGSVHERRTKDAVLNVPGSVPTQRFYVRGASHKGLLGGVLTFKYIVI